MKYIILLMTAVSVLAMTPAGAFGDELLLRLGTEQLVKEANSPNDLRVLGYSVPSYVDWNNDDRKDLVIGEGGGGFGAFVRVYLNNGTPTQPEFSDYFYVQSDGNDLTHYWDDCNCGCLGLFPRVVYWDSDNRKDIIVGTADGYVKLFLNNGTDEAPTFDGGTMLQVGLPGSKQDINVVYRATPIVVDWNSDGKKDLVVGDLYGIINLFVNEGTDTEPNFLTQTFAQQNGGYLVVPELRSSPVVLDLDGDGKKDLLSGDTEGQLLFYSNVATDQAPAFSGYLLVDSNGVPINLYNTPRSRPFVCDWTGDGYLDVLIGAGDGKVHLYESIPQQGDIDKDFDVDIIDYSMFAEHWMLTDCGLCGGADLTNDGNVDMDDLFEFTANWLVGVE